jgi:hypothetical protein
MTTLKLQNSKADLWYAIEPNESPMGWLKILNPPAASYDFFYDTIDELLFDEYGDDVEIEIDGMKMSVASCISDCAYWALEQIEENVDGEDIE